MSGANGRDFKISQSRVHNLNIEMSADRFKSVWESLARRVAKWITTKH
jgi:hypothetical protein